MLRYAAAQQNWAAVPCYKPNLSEEVNRMFVDSLNNEIILNSNYGYQACNITYKGVFAFNGNTFRDLDFGLNKHDPNPGANGYKVMDCVPFNSKTLFGGAFLSVGSNTLFAKSIALWNGAVWDTFPKYCFPNNLSGSGGGINGFLRHNGKLLIYGAFDTIGGIITKNVCSFDGSNFAAVPSIPVVDNYVIGKLVAYKNKLIASGAFYSYTVGSISRVAMFDGTNWSSVGNGVWGSLSFVNDMVIYNDTLYIAGSWPQSAGNVSNYIMKWDGNQLYDAGFGGFHGTDAITSLVVYKDRLFTFGNFNQAAGKKAYGIAYYEKGNWTVPQDSIANYGVRYGVVYNGDLYIAGAFKNINKDTTIRNFAKLVCPDFDAASGCISSVSKNSLNELRIRFFPNPVQDKLHIDFERKSDIDKISVVNTLGQEIFAVSKSELEIDLSFLSNGIYFLKVSVGQNQRVFKLVKE